MCCGHFNIVILYGNTYLFMCVYRNIQYYEKVTDPLDLSTIEKQILTGHYKTVEAFDADMLKVFRNAEVSPTSQALLLCLLLTNMIILCYNVSITISL